MSIHKHPVLGFLAAALLLAACSTPATQATLAATAVPTGLPAAEAYPTAQPAVAGVEAASSPAVDMPLEEALGSLEPQDVFQNFYEITQVPRPSGYMDQIREFLINFGQDLGLETAVDEAGNVIIRKPAAAGWENRQDVVLQAHMDMVPQKEV